MSDEKFFCCVLRMVGKMGGELVGYDSEKRELCFSVRKLDPS